MEKVITLSALRDKLDIVLFVNQHFYSYGCSMDEMALAFFTLQDELNELAKIYEQTRDILEQHI